MWWQRMDTTDVADLMYDGINLFMLPSSSLPWLSSPLTAVEV